MPDNSFHRDASNRLTFGMFNIPGDNYSIVCSDLVHALHLKAIGTPVSDFVSLIFQEYCRNSNVIGLEWDNWSGFMVVAKTPDSEPLVHEAAAWLLKSKWVVASS